MTPIAKQSNSVLVVLVVYNKGISDIASWNILLRWLEGSNSLGFGVSHILIYDNSADHKADSDLICHPNISYVHDSSNGGTAAAYTYGVELAKRLDIGWLLLLDHDTELPNNFLSAASQAKEQFCDVPLVFIPQVMHGNLMVSPAIMTAFGSIRPSNGSSTEGRHEFVTAVSSGLILSTNLLGSVLPFPAGLWLDYVDHWMFYEVNRNKYRVAIFDAKIMHDLSVASPKLLSIKRLRSILDGEAVFHRLRGGVSRWIYPFRLFARTIRYTMIKPSLALETMRWAIKRIIHGL